MKVDPSVHDVVKFYNHGTDNVNVERTHWYRQEDRVSWNIELKPGESVGFGLQALGIGVREGNDSVYAKLTVFDDPTGKHTDITNRVDNCLNP